MSLPTKEEEAILEKFRENVADILTPEERDNDMYLLRWLRARDLNLKNAEDMLRKAKIWRRENNLDNFEISQKSNSYYTQNFPMVLEAMDKSGRPVIEAHIGKWDLRKVTKDDKSIEFVSYLTQLFEETMHALKIASRMKSEKNQEDNEDEDIKRKHNASQVTQIIGILDWSGFAWSQVFNYQCMQNFLQIGSIYEAYYPEILYLGVFINCPPLISAVMTLLKPVLVPKTMAKIKCFGTDKKQWRDELLKYIDEDQLRPQFGGTREENDKNPFLSQ